METNSRRRRPAVSCRVCRRRKIKCNRETPCSNCVRSRGTPSCIYDSSSPSSPSLRPDSVRNSDISATAVLSTQSDIEPMRNRIQELEKQLFASNSVQSAVSTPHSSTERTTLSLGGNFYVQSESSMTGQRQPVTRGITHKTRHFGQSHWINVLQAVCDTADWYTLEESSGLLSTVQECKSLARIIKSQRAPSFLLPPNPELPPKELADELLDGYLRTLETVHRVLHVPTFKQNYEALWVSNSKDSEPNMAFLMQTKLVLAIGAVVYDEKFSLRSKAARWVSEAENWVSEPKFKTRLDIPSLQTNILLLFARELVGFSGDLIWISAGALFRKALYMGLHQDPRRLPAGSTFDNEMRRRLWNTILEIALQSSLSSGGPPLISLHDFDTECPRNFDDDQLMVEDSIPKPEEDYTQTSVAIILRKTFPTRLAIARFLNDLNSNHNYEEALRLDSELRGLYQSICQTFACHLSRSPLRFEPCVLEFLIHRYLCALHVPFFHPTVREVGFAYSREVAVETSVKIWYLANPSPSIPTAQGPGSGPGYAGSVYHDDLSRLVLCGSGFFRTVAMQAALLIAAELQVQVKSSISPIPMRLDLQLVIEYAEAWCLRCIEAGETNIKGYLLMRVVAAHLDGLRRGSRGRELEDLVSTAIADATSRCLPILENIASKDTDEGILPTQELQSLQQAVEPISPNGVHDWDTLIPDSLVHEKPPGVLDWIFNDELIQ